MAACSAPERSEVIGLDQGALLSEGSRHHWMGRCKPCAFYHSKGCQNGPACLFCHQCPPFEAQRRQRVRRQLLRPLFGHMRQGSDASTASTADGSSRRFSHSRQSSGASTSSVGEDAFVPSPMAAVEAAAAAAQAAAWEDSWRLAGAGPMGPAPGGDAVGQSLPAVGAPHAPPGNGGAGRGALQYVLVPMAAPPQQPDHSTGLPMPVPWLPAEALSGKHETEPAARDSGYESPATAAGY